MKTETDGTSEAREIEALVPAVLTLLQETSGNDPLLAAAVCGQSLTTLCHIAAIDIETLLVAIREDDRSIHHAR
jgi:hypothetical protein